jgi:hypothetical protein
LDTLKAGVLNAANGRPGPAGRAADICGLFPSHGRKATRH